MPPSPSTEHFVNTVPGQTVASPWGWSQAFSSGHFYCIYRMTFLREEDCWVFYLSLSILLHIFLLYLSTGGILDQQASFRLSLHQKRPWHGGLWLQSTDLSGTESKAQLIYICWLKLDREFPFARKARVEMLGWAFIPLLLCFFFLLTVTNTDHHICFFFKYIW